MSQFVQFFQPRQPKNIHFLLHLEVLWFPNVSFKLAISSQKLRSSKPIFEEVIKAASNYQVLTILFGSMKSTLFINLLELP